MSTLEQSWEACVPLAAHFLAIEQAEVHLWHSTDVPWELATHMRPGGSHRLGMTTSVWFEAAHPCGLTFHWSLDLEIDAANGEGHYEIATEAIRHATRRLPMLVRHQFVTFLAACAEKVNARGQEYARLAEQQLETAAELWALSGEGTP